MDSGGRDMRGASYMDQYDSNYGDNTYESTRKDSKDDLGGCAKCTKHTLFAVNFVMLLIGVALIVVVFFLKENDGGEDITFAITDTVVWLSVIIGAMIIIISFLGCVGATTHSKCILTIFIILLMLCLILELAGIIIIFTDESLVKDNAEKTWNSSTEEQRQKFAEDNGCAVDGQPADFEICWDAIQEGIDKNLFIVGGVVIGVFVYQLIMTIFAFFLCCKIGKGRASINDEV